MEFVKCLRNQIQLETKLEAGKQDLALKPDFNLIDAFRLFDIQGRGFTTSVDLMKGASKLHLFPSKEEIFLFIMRYDRKSEGKLR